MTKEYKPIACGLYDELELRALRKSKVELSYNDSKNYVQTIEGTIADIFSKDNVEYLKTDRGLLIRLDDIIELDGILFNKQC